jgi:hypothetical protein
MFLSIYFTYADTIILKGKYTLCLKILLFWDLGIFISEGYSFTQLKKAPFRELMTLLVSVYFLFL